MCEKFRIDKSIVAANVLVSLDGTSGVFGLWELGENRAVQPKLWLLPTAAKLNGVPTAHLVFVWRCYFLSMHSKPWLYGEAC